MSDKEKFQFKTYKIGFTVTRRKREDDPVGWRADLTAYREFLRCQREIKEFLQKKLLVFEELFCERSGKIYHHGDLVK